jgi:hypothetical protein
MAKNFLRATELVTIAISILLAIPSADAFLADSPGKMAPIQFLCGAELPQTT